MRFGTPTPDRPGIGTSRHRRVALPGRWIALPDCSLDELGEQQASRVEAADG